MNKKISILIITILFLFPFNIKALEIKETNSNCNLTKTECENNESCVWINSRSCGIISQDTVNYTCYYKYYSNPVTIFVTANFNQSGLVSATLEHDQAHASDMIAGVASDRSPVTYTSRDRKDKYYTCPDALYEYKSEKVKIQEVEYLKKYFDVAIGADHEYSTKFDLVKSSNYNGVMAHQKPNSPTIPSRNPLECYYDYNKDGVKVTYIVTYVDVNTVTVKEVMDMSSNATIPINTDFIKKSTQFKNWECATNDSFYVGYNDGVKYITYNKNDLQGIDDNFVSFGDSNHDKDYGDNPGDYNPGDKVYGCEVIPVEIREWIISTLNLVKYICLALVIVLGVLDFIKAAASGEADALKKSGQSFLKRVIAVAILFLLPVLVELILNLIEIYGVNPDNPLCTK